MTVIMISPKLNYICYLLKVLVTKLLVKTDLTKSWDVLKWTKRTVYEFPILNKNYISKTSSYYISWKKYIKIKDWLKTGDLSHYWVLIVKSLQNLLQFDWKKIFPCLTLTQQTAYILNRCICMMLWSWHSIGYDLLNINEKLKIEKHLVIVDTEKAFGFVSHDSAKNSRIYWFHLTGWGFFVATQYLKFEKGVRQGDQISVYLFVLCLKILFVLMKNNEEIKGLRFLE